MTVETVKKQIVEILENICAGKEIESTEQLLTELAIDSLGVVMLLVMIEDDFDIELEESDMDPFALINVQDVIDLVSKYKIETEVKQNG